MQRLHVIAVCTLVGLLSIGCEALAGLMPPPTPQVCAQVYSARRCLAIADAATAYSEHTRDDVASIVILPDPTPKIGPDGVILETTSGHPLRIRVLLRDGATFDTILCGGVANGPACSDEPQAWETGGTDLIGGGYHDVPAGSTPIPSIDPAVAEDGIPIEVASRTIPIDHAGPYEILLGTGALPNGVLAAATYRIVDPWATDVTYDDETAPQLEIRSLEPDGRPFRNAYEHGWREGVERVEAFLTFDVKRFDPGAVIEVADVLVR